MPTIRSAPTRTRKLIRDLGYTRRRLWQASKAERDGVPGADVEVDEIIHRLRSNVQRACDATDHAEAVADDISRAHLILKSGVDLQAVGSLSALAAIAVKIGCCAPMLTPLTEVAATQAKEAADRSRDRLDSNWADIRSAETMADLSLVSREAGFKDTFKTRRLRARMNAFKEASR